MALVNVQATPGPPQRPRSGARSKAARGQANVVDLGARRPRSTAGPLVDQLRSGILSVANAEVELAVHGDETSVRLRHGRIGLFGNRASTTLVGARETLETILRGEQSGIEAFLDGRVRVRGNIALALQLEGLFATKARPARFPRPRTIRAAGVDTFYLEAGSGPPVILLHGLGATNASMLPTLWDLARDHRVLAPDLPGFGESGKPLRAYDAAFFARWLEAFMDATGIRRAHLVGNSMGGRIALEAGLRIPSRLERLVLLAPGVAFIKGRQYVPLVRLLRPEMALVPVLLNHWEIVQAARSLFAKPERLQPEWYDSFADEFLRVWASPRARIAFFSAARQIYLDQPAGDKLLPSPPRPAQAGAVRLGRAGLADPGPLRPPRQGGPARGEVGGAGGLRPRPPVRAAPADQPPDPPLHRPRLIGWLGGASPEAGRCQAPSAPPRLLAQLPETAGPSPPP